MPTTKEVYRLIDNLFERNNTPMIAPATAMGITGQGLGQAIKKQSLTIPAFLKLLEFFKISPKEFFQEIETNSFIKKYSPGEISSMAVNEPPAKYETTNDKLMHELIRAYKTINEKDQKIISLYEEMKAGKKKEKSHSH